jgi:hypothetical protein
MTTRLDTRQVISRDALDQIATVTDKKLDDLLRSINSELTMPLRMVASPTPNLVVNIESIFVSDSTDGTGRTRTIPTISNMLPNFTGGTVTLPADIATGTVTVSPGTNNTISGILSNGNFIKMGISLSATGNLSVQFGSEGATVTAATIPPNINNAFNIGYIVVEADGSGNIQVVENSDIFQYVGGSGNGGSSNINEDFINLRNSLSSSSYKYLTSSIFISEDIDLVDTVNTTANFNAVDSLYEVDTSEIIQSLDLLDSSFYEEQSDINSAILTVFYENSSVDPAATYELSRDNGTTWQPIYLNRNGLTNEFSGVLNFASETLSVEGSISTNNVLDLDASSQQKLAQLFTLAETRIIEEFTIELNKTGSPNGKITVKLVREDSGEPSIDNNDLISLKEIDVSSLVSGNNTINLGKQVLSAGDYFLVLETDASYKNSYSNGVDEVTVGTETPTSGADALSNDGSTWSTVTNVNIQLSYTYKTLTLLVRITGSTASKIQGFGVLYGEETNLLSPVQDQYLIVGTSAQVDAGIATHLSLQNALNNIGSGGTIQVLGVSLLENITITQSDIVIEGSGRNSIIDGTLTISGSNNLIKRLRFTEDIIVTGDTNSITDSWVANDADITDNGLLNNISIIWE